MKSILVIVVCLFVSVGTFAQTAEFKLILSGPEAVESDDLKILPTPFRILQQTASDERFEVKNDFGDVVYNPLLSIQDGRVEKMDDLEAGSKKRFQWRTEQTVQSELETSLDFVSNRPVLYIELGGFQVFWLYDANYLEAVSRRRSEHILGAVQLPVVETNNLSAVRFSLFRFDDKISGDTITRVRTDYQKNEESMRAYISRYTRTKTQDGNFVEGLTGPLGRNREYRGYVFSTCVEFRKRAEPVTEPLWDESSKCWIYDYSQLDALLPTIPGDFVLELQTFQEQEGGDVEFLTRSFKEFSVKKQKKSDSKFVTLR